MAEANAPFRLKFEAAYAARPDSLDLTKRLSQASVSEKDGFSLITGSYGEERAYVGVSGHLVISDSRNLLYNLSTGAHPQVRPLLFSWALAEPASLDWVVDETKLPSGHAMHAVVLRDKTSDAFWAHKLSEAQGIKQIFRKLVADDSFRGFAMLTSNFQMGAGDIVKMLFHWDGSAYADSKTPIEERQVSEAMSKYFTLNDALHFEPVPFSRTRLKRAHFGEPLLNLYAANTWAPISKVA